MEVTAAVVVVVVVVGVLVLVLLCAVGVGDLRTRYTETSIPLKSVYQTREYPRFVGYIKVPTILYFILRSFTNNNINNCT